MSEQTILDVWDSTFAGNPVRIALVSPVRIIRESLAELLPRDRRLSIAGVFEDPSCALPQLEDPGADLALVDANLSAAHAFVAAIRKAVPRVPIVVFSITETLEEVVAWAEAGASGYVPKIAGLTDMAEMLVEIKKGRQACSLRGTELRLGHRLNTRDPQERYHHRSFQLILTARETEIIKLIGQGMSNKEIARHLNIGVATTKTHVHHIFGKLNVQHRGQATRLLRGQEHLI